MHNRQFLPECELVLFRNDLSGQILKKVRNFFLIRASTVIAQRSKLKDRTSKVNGMHNRQFLPECELVLFRKDSQRKSLEKCSAKIPRRACAGCAKDKDPNRISNDANGSYRTSKFTLKWPKSLEFCQFR